MPDESLDRFLLQLDAIDRDLRSADAVWALSVAFFARNGFDRIIYLRQQGGRLVQKTTLGDEWLARYKAQDAARFDPFLTICCQSYRPVATGIDYLARHDALGPAQRALIRAAGDMGMRAGFSITTRARRLGGIAGRDGVAGWNLGSSRGAREVEGLRADRQDRLRLAARHACAALAWHDQPVPGPPLSPREREALMLSADGLRTKQIAHALGVTPGAIELYLRNARKKLGAATREHAVAIAFSGGQPHRPPATPPAERADRGVSRATSR